MIDIAPYAGPVVITLAYVVLYYAFQVNVARAKTQLSREYTARGERFDRYFSHDRQMLAADRIQLNMLEHMPPFLVLLWLVAVFVSPTRATIAGGVYVAARTLYPLLMGNRLGRGIRSVVLVSTVPGYLVLAWLLGELVTALLR